MQDKGRQKYILVGNQASSSGIDVVSDEQLYADASALLGMRRRKLLAWIKRDVSFAEEKAKAIDR